MIASLQELEALARRLRGDLVEMSHRAATPHLASALSCVDILVAAYWGALRIDPASPQDPLRDRLVFSKGHAVTALYAALARRGFFPVESLAAFAKAGGQLAEQPIPRGVPGLEAATGSLGHGLPLGVGMALAGRIQKRGYRVFAVLSDGECEEGSVWEAALFAGARRLDNLMVIVDYNKWQATGRSNQVMALDPLARKWEAFGFSAHELDGHDLNALLDAFARLPDGSGRPVAVVAHTIKGKGVSFMEDDNNWHYRSPDAQELARAKLELGLA